MAQGNIPNQRLVANMALVQVDPKGIGTDAIDVCDLICNEFTKWEVEMQQHSHQFKETKRNPRTPMQTRARKQTPKQF